MSDWKFNCIVNSYRWADGFTNVKQTKLQRRLGDGCNYGMMWILCGVGLIPTFSLAIILMTYGWLEDAAFGLSFAIIYFGFGLLLEFICSIERDKSEYNEEINIRKQLNLFRDFGIKQT